MPTMLPGLLTSVVTSFFWLLHPGEAFEHATALGVAAGTIGALATATVFGAHPPASLDAPSPSPDDAPADPDRAKEERQRRKLETAIMPAGVRTVAAGSDRPVWLYARMLSAPSPDATFQPDEDLTEGIRFRIVRGGPGVELTERENAGDWIAAGVTVRAPADGSPPPDAVVVAAERFTRSGTLYHRRTFLLRVVAG